MKKITDIIIASAAAAMLLTSCGDGNKWTVKGNMAHSEGNDYLVEAYDNGRWYLLDTLKVKSSGDYSYSHEAMGYPDVYRIRCGEASIYFPIDSIETISIFSRGDAFGADYTIGGTPQADAMMSVDSIINAAGADAVGNVAIMRELANIILQDPSSIVSYYIINRRVGGKPIFDPSDPVGRRIIGAVANAYDKQRPSDPRTAYLRNLFIENLRAATVPDSVRVIEAYELSAPEIKLYDNKGAQRLLSDEAAKGNVILLNFTAYSAEESPAFNVGLNKIYEKYKESGFEIFQVAIDHDEYAWKRTADNLPWITVINDASDSERVIRDYNVGSIPCVFILNRKGEVVERVTDLSKLESLVAKYL